jgi:hypothetical protein
LEEVEDKENVEEEEVKELEELEEKEGERPGAARPLWTGWSIALGPGSSGHRTGEGSPAAGPAATHSSAASRLQILFVGSYKLDLFLLTVDPDVVEVEEHEAEVLTEENSSALDLDVLLHVADLQI